MINQVPKIQKPVITANSNAIHYGYCAFKEINLAGSCGLEHKVQPAESPYYRVLPHRQLIPFVSIEVNEVNEAVAGQVMNQQSRAVPIVKVPKSAEVCAAEMEHSYQDWGFQVLRPITGLDEDTAMAIFQTIQPFPYKLKDILNELDFGAIERIHQEATNEDGTYTVVYEDFEIDLLPLPEHLRETAEKVRALMAISAEVAVSKGEDIHTVSEVNLTSFLASGQGKRRPDPLDIYVYAERGDKLPSLNRTPDAQVITTSESKESLDLKRRDIELREKEFALRERELALKERPAPKIGDAVSVEGQAAKIVGKPFGKVKVEFENGETKVVNSL